MTTGPVAAPRPAHGRAGSVAGHQSASPYPPRGRSPLGEKSTRTGHASRQGKVMGTTNTPAGPAGADRPRPPRDTAAAGARLNLDLALSRIADLDDEQLQDLVNDLDSALADCRGCLTADDMDLISVAAGARITLRRRRAVAARSRAIHRVHQLISGFGTIKTNVGGTE